MRILNIGSMNVDHVYAVEHFVRPGETLSGSDYSTFAGGKGFNQSIALAHAGAQVSHLGCIGQDGKWLMQRLEEASVDTTHVNSGLLHRSRDHPGRSIRRKRYCASRRRKPTTG